MLVSAFAVVASLGAADGAGACQYDDPVGRYECDGDDVAARRAALDNTTPPARPVVVTAPIVPVGYDGVVPEPDHTARIVAAVVGGLVGVGVAVGLVAVLNSAEPDLFNGAPTSAVLAVLVLGGAGAGVGSVVVAPSPHPQAARFARYEQDRREYDSAVVANEATAKQWRAWERALDETSSSSSSSSPSPSPPAPLPSSTEG